MTELQKIITHLKQNDDVDAVFLTGSVSRGDARSHSDIDLVVILKENKLGFYSFYRWIDGTFADIFFFDLADLARMGAKNIDDGNGMDAVFLDWLKKADVRFDKSGTLTALQKAKAGATFSISTNEKRSFWQKINYNFVANKRYFESNDPLYHQALELRLLYSVIEVVCGYLAFRDIPWRGEKEAIRNLSSYAPKFYALFQKYSAAASLKDRFDYYSKMVGMAFTDEYPQWETTDAVLVKKGQLVADKDDSAVGYINSLFGI